MSNKASEKKASQAATMSNEQLKKLIVGPRITVVYKDQDDAGADRVRVLRENFPKNVATAFSIKWEAELRSMNKRNVGDIRKVGTKSVTVAGASFEVYRDMLEWMLASCRGLGFAQIPNQLFKPYSYHFFLRECAASIGCDTLKERANTRMERLSVEQIHSEDVRVLWLVDPPIEEMRTFLVEHVATRFWQKRLKAKGAYWTLREEFPDMHQRINTFLAQMKDDTAGDSRGLELGSAALRGRPKGTGNDSAPKIQEKEVKEQTNDEGEGKTVTLKMEIVRKATNKTPAYAKLDLASVGVTRERFCGPRY